MSHIDMANPSLRSNSSFSPNLSIEKGPSGQLWLDTYFTRGTGMITPPSDVSTPISEKAFSGLFGPVSTSIRDQPSSISPSDEPTVAVLGVGYVGTHLVSAFSSKYPVIGFDVSKPRINDLRASQLNEPVDGSREIEYTWDTATLSRATHFLVSVPTLLRPDHTVDASFLCSALQAVEKHARTGATIVIESSVAVGMTRELLGPLAQKKGFFAGMSPEVRIPVNFPPSSIPC
jgi:threonine dehydrogenase-like Zn-dependent dehydrogenase